MRRSLARRRGAGAGAEGAIAHFERVVEICRRRRLADGRLQDAGDLRAQDLAGWPPPLRARARQLDAHGAVGRPAAVCRPARARGRSRFRSCRHNRRSRRRRYRSSCAAPAEARSPRSIMSLKQFRGRTASADRAPTMAPMPGTIPSMISGSLQRRPTRATIACGARRVSSARRQRHAVERPATTGLRNSVECSSSPTAVARILRRRRRVPEHAWKTGPMSGAGGNHARPHTGMTKPLTLACFQSRGDDVENFARSTPSWQRVQGFRPAHR